MLLTKYYDNLQFWINEMDGKNMMDKFSINFYIKAYFNFVEKFTLFFLLEVFITEEVMQTNK